MTKKEISKKFVCVEELNFAFGATTADFIQRGENSDGYPTIESFCFPSDERWVTVDRFKVCSSNAKAFKNAEGFKPDWIQIDDVRINVRPEDCSNDPGFPDRDACAWNLPSSGALKLYDLLSVKHPSLTTNQKVCICEGVFTTSPWDEGFGETCQESVVNSHNYESDINGGCCVEMENDDPGFYDLDTLAAFNRHFGVVPYDAKDDDPSKCFEYDTDYIDNLNDDYEQTGYYVSEPWDRNEKPLVDCSYRVTDETRLAIAAKSGSEDDVAQILARGCDVNSVSDLAEASPLAIAAAYGRINMTRYLIERGATIPDFEIAIVEDQLENCSEAERKTYKDILKILKK